MGLIRDHLLPQPPSFGEQITSTLAARVVEAHHHFVHSARKKEFKLEGVCIAVRISVTSQGLFYSRLPDLGCRSLREGRSRNLEEGAASWTPCSRCRSQVRLIAPRLPNTMLNRLPSAGLSPRSLSRAMKSRFSTKCKSLRIWTIPTS